MSMVILIYMLVVYFCKPFFYYQVLQGNVEKDISGRYNGRRVNIMGGIQTLSWKAFVHRYKIFLCTLLKINFD